MGFKKNDSGFVCKNCGKEVLPLNYTSRNHCPYCLHSLHIDITPGDRLNDCKGMLIPIGIELSSKKGTKIIFKCNKCGKITKNISANDDNYEAILELSKNTKPI